MASRSISTILNLRDNMSGGLVRVSRRVSGMSREAQRASRQVANMANKFKQKTNEMVNAGTKIAGLGASIAGAFAIKTGLSEALDLEGYRIQLETATKDTKKAGEIMKWAVDLANKTPFEAAPLVEGASKLEMMGISAKKYLPLIGDMTAATNKDVMQGVEALIDAQAGELERLKEFGITKQHIIDKANKIFKGKQIVNNKGQIVNQKKFNEALVAIMTERYKGGMDKLSNTTKGLWSTITGVTKSSLAEMVGMTSDGTIKQGSLLDKLKEKVKQVADRFSKWQSDGTIQNISQKFTEAFIKIYDVASKLFNFIKEHEKLISTIVVAMAGFAVAIKIATALKTAIVGLQIVWAIFNGTLALSPLGWIVIGITALITAGYALWRNWDAIKAKAFELWEAMKSAFAPLGEFFSNLWSGVKDGFKGFINFIIGGLNSMIEGLNNFASFKLPDWIPGIGGKGFELSIPTIPKFALGTQYFKGGLAQINERGGEIVNLPNGSKVIPADKSAKMVKNSSGNVTVNVIVQGNVIGNNEFINQVGEVISTRIKTVLPNM